MSPESPDAASPAPHPRTFSSATLVGVACFAVGLLLVAGGVLLAVQWLLTGHVVSIVIGILLALIGIATNATGLVLLYRDVTRPVNRSRNDNKTP